MKTYRKLLKYMVLLASMLFIYACTKKENSPSSPASTPAPPFSAIMNGNPWPNQAVTGSSDSGKFYIQSAYVSEYESELLIYMVLSNDTVGTYPVTSSIDGCGGSYYANGPSQNPTQVTFYDSTGSVTITKSVSKVLSGNFQFVTHKVDGVINTYNGSFNNISCK